DLIGWLPTFLAGVAILQPIDAEIRGVAQAEIFGSAPDFAPPSRIKPEYDEALDFANDVYVPSGSGPSWWEESDAFAAFMAQQTIEADGLALLAGSDEPVGVRLGEDRLILVTLDNQPTPITLHSSERHPQLGSGL